MSDTVSTSSTTCGHWTARAASLWKVEQLPLKRQSCDFPELMPAVFLKSIRPAIPADAMLEFFGATRILLFELRRDRSKQLNQTHTQRAHMPQHRNQLQSRSAGTEEGEGVSLRFWHAPACTPSTSESQRPGLSLTWIGSAIMNNCTASPHIPRATPQFLLHELSRHNHRCDQSRGTPQQQLDLGMRNFGNC